MPMQFVCAACFEAGVRRELAQTDDFLVACSFCGNVNEQATYSRNAVDVSGAFGTLIDEDAVNDAKFLRLREKKHDDFIDTLLDTYLVEPGSRLVDRPAAHFKASTRSWYNRMRTHEEFARNLKHTSTNNDAKKVKYRLVVAIHFAIQESNIIVANNRLSRVKPGSSDASTSTVRGDGSIMAPTMAFIFSRVQALNPDHLGYLDSWSTLRGTYLFYSKALTRRTPLVDVIMSQVIVVCHRIEHMCKLPWHQRLGSMATLDLKQTSLKKGKTLETAEMDDFILDSAAWKFMSDVDWQRVIEVSYNLYCAQQVVFLWQHHKSVDIASALIIWAIQAVKQQSVPAVTGWAKEMCLPYGGNDNASLRRRSELRDMLVAWSTSFEAAGLGIPAVQPPAKGMVGDGLRGWASDKRRAIPEGVMATAAAPVVAENWQLLTQTRLSTRTWALPLDVEYTMAAKAFAKAYHEQFPSKRKSRFSSQATSRATSRAPSQTTSRATSRAPSYSPAPASTPPVVSLREPRNLNTREQMLRRMNLTPTPGPPTPPTIEEILATREDSSDEEDDDDDDGRSTHDWSPRIPTEPEQPFGFSIGPTGFSVSQGQAADSTESSRKRSIPEHDAHRAKRLKSREPTIPPSPPATTSTSRPSPTPSRTIVSATASPYPPSSPSLRAISMSPALTTTSLTDTLPPEHESTHYIGLLLRERDQYVTYNPADERKRGTAVSAEVESAMNAWVENAKSTGKIPQVITPRYLASLGMTSDPRRQDLGLFIKSHAHEWSATESLLRLGIRPIEFPPHLVVYSLLDLERQLGTSLDALNPMGTKLTTEELDEELELLFSYGDESVTDILASGEEAERKERYYMSQGMWLHPRGIPEGRSGKPLPLEVEKKSTPRDVASLPPTGSKRINYDALRRLCEVDSDDTLDTLEDVLDDALEVVSDNEE